MAAPRELFIKTVRQYLGVRFSHQGRTRATGIDCGGLALVAAREIGILDLEFLGYASFPTDGKFEELLEQNSIFLGEYRSPFAFTGEEMKPGDLLSFDYGSGEGTRHLALITEWDGRRYRVIEAQPTFGVSEHALAAPFVNRKTVLKAWRMAAFV